MHFNDGANPSHETRVSGRTIIVGGTGESKVTEIDRLAVQKGMLNCAPNILNCLIQGKTSLPIEFVVSFDLSASTEVALASNFKFSLNSTEASEINKCIENENIHAY